MYIVSGCLLGHRLLSITAETDRNDGVMEFCKSHRYMAVFFVPERAANLPCPRPPAEKVGNRILSKTGEDVTEAFVKRGENIHEHVQ